MPHAENVQSSFFQVHFHDHMIFKLVLNRSNTALKHLKLAVMLVSVTMKAKYKSAHDYVFSFAVYISTRHFCCFQFPLIFFRCRLSCGKQQKIHRHTHFDLELTSWSWVNKFKHYNIVACNLCIWKSLFIYCSDKVSRFNWNFSLFRLNWTIVIENDRFAVFDE